MNCDNLRPLARELNKLGQCGGEKVKRHRRWLFLERYRAGEETDG